MSRVISDIIGAPEPHFSHTLKNWERVTGGSGHDLRLLSDIAQSRKKAVTALQLDHTDTTPRELYFALRHHAVQTNDQLMVKLGISNDDTSDEIVAKIVLFIDSLSISRDVWTIKHAVIKQLLIKHVPKKTLKTLGLRSIDSVLKRSSAYELLAIAYQIESLEWSKKMHTFLKKLHPTDFQATKSEIFTLNVSRAEKLHKNGHDTTKIVFSTPETGTVLAVPPTQRFPLDVVAITLSLLETLYELRVYSAYFRLVSTDSHFGTRLHQIIHNGISGKISEGEIGWKVLQRHFNHDRPAFDELEQPHLQYEDIALFTPLQALAEAIPEFDFWNQNSHVFMVSDSKPVSMHLFDVVTNASNQLPLEKSVYLHLQQRLQEELMLRYMQHTALRNIALKQFEGAL